MTIIRPDKDMAAWVQFALPIKDFDDGKIANTGAAHGMIRKSG
jgi:hypothetical protein